MICNMKIIFVLFVLLILTHVLADADSISADSIYGVRWFLG
jgi:hypothetical protein